LRTRQRIQRLAKLRGYKPDPTITKLMQHLRTTEPTRNRANICGLLVASSAKDYVRHSFSSRIEQGLKEKADALGFSYSRVEIPDGRSRSRLQSLLRNRGIEGVVLLPMPDQSNLTGLLDWAQFSVIAVTTSVLEPRFHRVTPHHFDNALRTFRELEDKGFKRIGLAISRRSNERVRYRWSGAVLWQNAFGGTLPIPPFFGSTASLDLDEKTFVDWLQCHQPDAILVEAIDPVFLTQAIEQANLAIKPMVVSINWSPGNPSFGMDQRPDAIGAVAIEILAGMIYRGERGLPEHALNIAVDGVWIWSEQRKRGKSVVVLP